MNIQFPLQVLNDISLWALLLSIIALFFAVRRDRRDKLSNKRQATEFEKQYFTNILSDIVDMKKWAAKSEFIMKAIADDVGVKEMLDSGVAKDEKDLLDKCIMFFYLERIYYHLRYCKKVSGDAENLGVELKMWLNISQLESFFCSFCKPHKPYTKLFLKQVDEYYKAKKLGPEEAEAFAWR